MGHKFNPESRHKLDNPQRRALLPPEETLSRLGMEAGDSVVDIGCGIGYFTLPAARMVGSQGRVYGLDIAPEMVEETKSKVSESHLANVEVLLVRENDFLLPNRTGTYAFACLVAHEAGDLNAFFREIARILRPAGRVAVVEWEKRLSMMGPPLEHRLDSQAVADELRRCGFTNILQLPVNDQMYAVTGEKE
jgi:ubiquinone/menaquinone biosynthesis C-methylase UbiE